MSRLIALDTETTGLHSKEGDRIIELAMVEITREAQPRYYHQLFNPQGRKISAEAQQVHGISDEMLLDKPTFGDCIGDIFDFIGDDGGLVIHNAGFDLEFLRDECMEFGSIWPEPPVIDTLKLAIKEFPKSRHSLDALCNRFGVDLSSRTKHGALIDTNILKNLYLVWKGQAGLDLTAVTHTSTIVPAAQLGAMNEARVIVPDTALAMPRAPSWSRHFEGIDL